MAMWDDILNGLGVENGAARVNGDVERIAGSERGANGSFNPNAVRAGMPSEMDPEINMQAMLAEARLKALSENLKPPTRSGMQFFGDALSAASVPVAYAQGNITYGAKMAGNTMADQFNDRRRNYEDTLAKQKAGVVDGAYSSLGDSAVGYMKNQRENKAALRKQLASILAAGRLPDGSFDPSTLADAELLARTNGFQAEWEQVKQAIKAGTPQGSPSMGAPPAEQPPAVAPPATPPPAAQPSQGGPGLQGLSGIAQNLPGATPPPSAAPAPGRATLPTQTPAHIQEMYRKASVAAAMGDKPRADALMAQASDLSDIWKKQQESQFSRTNVSNSTLVYGTDANGKPVVMQPSSEGKLIQSQVPEGVEVNGPEGTAYKKQAGKDYAARYKEVQDNAVNALDQLGLLGMGAEALATGVYTGAGGEAVQSIQKLAVALGVASPETVNQVAGGELITGVQNRMALLMRSGGQMPGALSDNDIKFLRDSQFGIDKTPEANRRMLEAFQKLAQRKLDVARLADDYVAEHGQLDQGFSAKLREFAQANPLFEMPRTSVGPGQGERKFKVLR